MVSADYFSGLGDRLTPAAIIPMHTPDEAIAELEFVTKLLGSKVGMFGSNVARKVPAAAALRRRRLAACDDAEMLLGRRCRVAQCDKPIYVLVSLSTESCTRRFISSRNSS